MSLRALVEHPLFLTGGVIVVALIAYARIEGFIP